MSYTKPDNIEITGEFFTLLNADSYNKAANQDVAYNLSKITFTKLNELIGKGCAFLPALGHWTPWGPDGKEYPYRFNAVGTQGDYWSNTQGLSSKVVDYRDAAKYFTFYKEVMAAPSTGTSSVNRKGDFMSVRLVRDVE